MADITVIYDACVLYPAGLRNLLMHLALTEMFQARWTEEILDECFRSILADRPDLSPDRLRCGAQLIITANVRHFPSDVLGPYEVEAQHPDEFIADLIGLDPDSVCTAMRDHRASLKNPPQSVAEYVAALEHMRLETVARLIRPYAMLI